MTLPHHDVSHVAARSAHDATVRIPPVRGGLASFESHWLVVRGLARRQKIAWPDPSLRWESEYVLTKDVRTRWNDLFGVTEADRHVPLTYYEPTVIRMGHDALRRVGVNYRNLMYIGWELEVAARDDSSPSIDERCRLVGRLASIRPCRNRRAVVTLEGSLYGAGGKRLLTLRDSILVKGLSQRDVDFALAASGVSKSAVGPSLPPPAARPSTEDVRRFPVVYADDLGRRFGALSGDTNFLHTNRYAARLFGHRRLFAHGMCTANHVLKVLAHDVGAPVRRFSIAFRRPAYLGQTVDVRVGEEQFEVCDGAGVVVADGRFTRFDGPDVL